MIAPGAVARLLQEGGDHRLRLGPDGLSAYRIGATVRDSLPLGSCTGSSPSTHGVAAVQALLEHTSLDDAVQADAVAQAQRDRLRAVLGVGPEHEVWWFPSGTDAIYGVSALALLAADPVHHLVVGASELGGGTMQAARGECFTDAPPFGSLPSGQLSGLSVGCSAEPLHLREGDGALLDLDRVHREVTQRVATAVSAGRRVVLHLVAHSKTGLRAPGAGHARDLKAVFGDRLFVLVDAAQGRLAPADVRQALSLGFMVLFTGSKFYSGPPFSGALILPPPLGVDPGTLPSGLDCFVTRADLPTSWVAARSSLPEPANPGLLARWEAALAEMEAYHRVAPARRARVYHAFAGAVVTCLGACSAVDVDVPLPPAHRLATRLGAYPTVFPFRVRDGGGWLGADDLQTLHRWLDTAHPGDPAPPIHLGQPVRLGPPRADAPAMLRVALGARLVTRFADAPDGGGRWFHEVFERLAGGIEHWLEHRSSP